MNNNQVTGGGCCLDVNRLIAVIESQIGGGVTGPTGATGATGPAPTLVAGPVETLDSGVPATVSVTPIMGATGSYQISFGIPEGPTGPTGEAGPAVTLQAGAVTDLPSGSPATATVTPVMGAENTYEIALGIPAGPTGPADGLVAYAGLYDTDNTVDVTTNAASQETQIPLDESLPEKNATASGNQITVDQQGDYEISYTATVTTTTGAGSTNVFARTAGSELGSSVSTFSLQNNQAFTFTKTTIATLDAGETVDLAITPTAQATFTISNVSLIVKKLDGDTSAAA